MARLERDESIRDRVALGSARAAAGKSHSWLTAARSSGAADAGRTASPAIAPAPATSTRRLPFITVRPRSSRQRSEQRDDVLDILRAQDRLGAPRGADTLENLTEWWAALGLTLTFGVMAAMWRRWELTAAIDLKAARS